MQLAYIVKPLYPKVNEIFISPRKLSISQRAQIINKHSGNSLRELAKQYGVSYETVRRVLKSNK
ncbi:helix-turn-helix domain-containing protein [Chloroflexota bacterium]